MPGLDAVLDYIDAHTDAALERLFGLLRIPSVSTDPHHAADCRACAEWHAEDLRNIGFSASTRDTPGHPIVVAHDRSAQGISALFYGHYDVQPVEPRDLWTHDPFDPIIDTLPDGTRVIRARGASDDKGQVMTFVEACRAWKTVAGKLPIPISIFLEGEEASGGASLPPFLRTHADELRADIGLICDTHVWDQATPAIRATLCGLCGEERTITPADRDLAFKKARDALIEEWGHHAVFIGAGGSIPVTCELKQTLGMEVILAGFALEDDRIHSPNEKYNLESFRRGTRSWARILHALAQ